MTQSFKSSSTSGILIPYPKESHNHARAVIDPLTTEVGITAVASLVASLVAVLVASVLHCPALRRNQTAQSASPTIQLIPLRKDSLLFLKILKLLLRSSIKS